jgi:hypothetical protein
MAYNLNFRYLWNPRRLLSEYAWRDKTFYASDA